MTYLASRSGQHIQQLRAQLSQRQQTDISLLVRLSNRRRTISGSAEIFAAAENPPKEIRLP